MATLKVAQQMWQGADKRHGLEVEGRGVFGNKDSTKLFDAEQTPIAC